MYLRQKYDESGSIIVSILVVTLFLTTVITGLIVLAGSNLTRSKDRVMLLQAQYAAESGADAAIAILNAGNESYPGTTTDISVLNGTTYKASYQVSVANGASNKEKVITATGKVYAPKTSASPSQIRKVEVIAQRTSTSTSLSIVSRNIIEVGSGVKNIIGKDIYANGYINMSKNTTNLVAENITVGSKNTSAANCSIGGTGNLVKPASFSNPAQTKTKITVAYNNCITPPGNTSNTSFDVLSGQSNIAKIQSTLIPYSQYMDDSYTNSNTGCNDWTTGTSPRTIPSAGNAKRTHYPDNGSNVSSSCSSGDINLGSYQFNITDHVHLRASLCAASACTPIFYNPSSTLRFVFVEGTINFESVRTANNSGPIVLVSYGADPASKTGSCPLGGAVYLGQGSPSSYTDAPNLYFLAVNGVCMDKTKFGDSPALGGVSGKNIYVATNSGTPFDLKLDPAFPSQQIPVDLSWRAARYRRI